MSTLQIKAWQRAIGVTDDGDFGPKTLDASLRYLPEKLDPAPRTGAPAAAIVYPRQVDMVSYYGPAGGPDCTAGRVTLPMPFKIAWDLKSKVTTFVCHKRVAVPMTNIFRQAFEHYGPGRMTALGLDLFGGCYNFRAMRGGTSLSMHSWGIAVDLDPERNALKMNHTQARFAQAEYEPFWNIVEQNGAVSLGRERDYDWMHFQFARL